MKHEPHWLDRWVYDHPVLATLALWVSVVSIAVTVTMLLEKLYPYQ